MKKEIKRYDPKQRPYSQAMVEDKMGGFVRYEDYKSLISQPNKGVISDSEPRNIIEGLLNIINDSEGVTGYHMNGNIAEWNEFEEVSIAEAWMRDNQHSQPKGVISDSEIEKEAYLAHDGINNDFECFDTLEFAERWLEEFFFDKKEGYHPDLELCKIYKLCSKATYTEEGIRDGLEIWKHKWMRDNQPKPDVSAEEKALEKVYHGDVKCATFDTDIQNNIPEHIKDKMKQDRLKAQVLKYANLKAKELYYSEDMKGVGDIELKLQSILFGLLEFAQQPVKESFNHLSTNDVEQLLKDNYPHYQNLSEKEKESLLVAGNEIAIKASGFKGEKKEKISYFAWLSTKGEKEEYNKGAKYAGSVSKIPKEFEHLLDESEERQYCAIY